MKPVRAHRTLIIYGENLFVENILVALKIMYPEICQRTDIVNFFVKMIVSTISPNIYQMQKDSNKLEWQLRN